MSERTSSFVFSFVALSVIGLLSSVVVGADMFSGTWKLNVAKSKYSNPSLRSGRRRDLRPEFSHFHRQRAHAFYG